MGNRPVGKCISTRCQRCWFGRAESVLLHAVANRLKSIGEANDTDSDHDLSVFYHPENPQPHSCSSRMVASARGDGSRTGPIVDPHGGIEPFDRHSPWLWEVYTLPPNQATSISAQRKINEKATQTTAGAAMSTPSF